MAKFKFRLDVLLRLALNEEDEAKKNLAAWQKRLLESLQKKDRILKNINCSLVEKVRQKNIDEIKLYENYLDSLRYSLFLTEGEIEFIEKEKDKAVEILQEAMKKRKILEKLKEKKHQQYIFEADQREQKEMDEKGTKIFTESRSADE